MVKYQMKAGQQELDVLKEIMLSSAPNKRKRQIAGIVSPIMVAVMVFYSIMCFLQNSVGYGIFGVLASLFFLWITIKGTKSYQKKILTHFQNKVDDRLKSGMREYCFDETGIRITSDLGSGEHRWEAFKNWGIFENYIYVRNIKNEMLLVKRNELSDADLQELEALLTKHLQKETIY